MAPDDNLSRKDMEKELKKFDQLADVLEVNIRKLMKKNKFSEEEL